jgi:hypothetical protein
LFPYDTRIYLDEIKNTSDDDCCINATVGENPSSAKPKKNEDNSLVKIELDGGELLSIVRNIILKVSVPKAKK